MKMPPSLYPYKQKEIEFKLLDFLKGITPKSFARFNISEISYKTFVQSWLEILQAI